jgi:hypothetical protein
MSDHGKNALFILAMDPLHPRLGRRIKALAAATPDSFVTRTNVQNLRVVHILQPKNFVDIFGKFAKTCLAFAQGPLRLFLFGDIYAGSDNIFHPPISINDCGVRPSDQTSPAIFCNPRILPSVRELSGDRPRKDALYRVYFLRNQ